MATKKKVAAKAVKSVKPTAPATKKATAPAKKVVAAPAKKASVPAKKVAPAKKAIAIKSIKKAAPAKKAIAVAKGSSKAAPAKKGAKAKIEVKAVAVKKAQPKPVSKQAKKNPSPVKNTTTSKTPAKKAAPASKAAPAKKVAETKVVKKVVAAPKPAPKAAAPAPKAEPVKKAVPVKAAEPVKAAAPVAKKTLTPPPPPPDPKKSKPAARTASGKKIVKAPIKTITTSVTGRPAPAPIPASATSRMMREEKKPNIIVAHRRVESKSAGNNESRTMINYQPDFNRSILDEPVQQQGPVYRYSDEELTEFRELITSRLESARKELMYLQGLITRKDEAGTEDTENRYMNMEDGSGAMEREQLAQLASRQIQFINHLEKAMIRIENKTYGICRVTGKLIDKARLRAVPHATLSIEAKKYMAGK
ncbi:MAG: TraR/DksA C4-type zinc finger protein [Flavipsychrobacter sp.]|nr:TraR/DksA C4-type zinc finger protein [Flavipsychrobacter sp.]